MLFLVYVTMLLCYLYLLFTVYSLRRCCWPSPKNFAALKQFGVCDNKLFDFDYDFRTLQYSTHGSRRTHMVPAEHSTNFGKPRL